jgi:hypothetical protein
VSWFTHKIIYKVGSGSPVSMPDAVTVLPVYKASENVFRTAGGVRKRSRKGVWAGCKIKWMVEASDLTYFDNLLTAENGDGTGTEFNLTVNNGTTYYNAHLASDPDIKPLDGKNVGLEINLEFEFVARISTFPTNLHLGS